MKVSQAFDVELCCAEGLPRWRYEWRRYVHGAVWLSVRNMRQFKGRVVTRAEYRFLIGFWGQEFFGAASFRDYIARRRQVEAAYTTASVVYLKSKVITLAP